MANMSRRKLTGLMLTGVAVIAIGGTETVLPQVGVATAQAAKLRTQTVAEAKADLQDAVDYFKDIAAKNPKDVGLQGVYADAQATLKDNKATVDDLQSVSLALNQYRDGYNSDGSIKNDSEDEEATEAGDNHGGDGIDYGGSESSNTEDNVNDAVTNTQDRKEYEESTAKDDQDSNTSNPDTSDSNGNSSVAGNSSSTDKTGSSSFSKQSVNAPGNAGYTTGTSSTSNTPSPTKTNSKKGNLPGTDEDKTQPVLIATIGLLGILGLGGTAFALWLRQRKHVNNE